MFLLLGATSYIGRAFARALAARKEAFVPLSTKTFDYSRFELLFDYVRNLRPELVINAEELEEMRSNGNGRSSSLFGNGHGNGNAGTRGHDAAGQTSGNGNGLQGHEGPRDLGAERTAMLQTNTVLPQVIARVCSLTRTPWAHLSSGSIFSGAKVVDNGHSAPAVDLAAPETRALFSAHPDRFHGFSEADEPNFSFRSAGTFYSGTKALAEEALSAEEQCYIWRFRLPFNEVDDPGNYLSQLHTRQRLHEALNSFSQVDECAHACLELWEKRATYGIYNVVNPGMMSTRQVLQLVQRYLKPPRHLRLLVYEESADGELASHPDCLLDCSKLLRTGVRLREVHEAMEKSLRNWVPQSTPTSSIA